MSAELSGSDPLRVVVGMKQVLDPEAPPALLDVDPSTWAVSGRGVAPRLDPYSEHALLAAVQLRERGDRPVDIHVVAAGPAPSRNLYLRALAAGADRVSLLDTSSRPVPFADAWATARRLAALLSVVAPEGCDLVLVGRRAADTNAGAVGPALARLLGWQAVTLATSVLPDPGAAEGALTGILVEQLSGAGTRTLRSPLPAVVSVSHEVGEPAAVPFARIVEAKRMPLEIVAADDPRLAADAAAPPGAGLRGVVPRDDRRTCEVIEAADARAAGRALARCLVAGVA